jgi:hypothetical protein
MVLFGVFFQFGRLHNSKALFIGKHGRLPQSRTGILPGDFNRFFSFKVLDPKVLEGFRKFPQTAKRASYSVYSTLVLREYNLDSFVAKPIAESFLTNLYDDFAAARAAGVKLIVRFAYVYKSYTGNCPTNTKFVRHTETLQIDGVKHISQLKKCCVTTKM